MMPVRQQSEVQPQQQAMSQLDNSIVSIQDLAQSTHVHCWSHPLTFLVFISRDSQVWKPPSLAFLMSAAAARMEALSVFNISERPMILPEQSTFL